MHCLRHALPLLLLASSSSLLAQEASPVAEPKTTRVALFKNGLGFFDAAVTLPERASTVNLSKLPMPTLGTFWLGYGDDVKLRSAVASMQDGDTVPAANLLELLRLNSGRLVRLYLREVAEQPLEVVEGLLVDKQPADSLMIRTETNVMVLAPETIARAEFLNTSEVTSTSTREKVPVLRINLEEPAPGKQVGLSYLARGITWTPAYRIDLSDPATAVLNAQALIINEAVDLENAHVDLITGYPHTPLASRISPLAMTQSLVEFLSGRSGVQSPNMDWSFNGNGLLGGGGGFGGGGFGGQSVPVPLFTNNAPVQAGEPVTVPAPEYPDALPGQAAEDLFLYPLENVSLKRGETAYFPLFSKSLPYKHLYTWRVGERPEGADNAPGQKLSDVVWHTCRLTNAGEMPLTTAPATFISKDAFIGQDTCYYTAAGAEATIRINRALSLTAFASELETERTRGQRIFWEKTYDRVVMQGTLSVQSRLGETATLEITKQLTGNLLDASLECKRITGETGPQILNPTRSLEWTLEVPAGGKQEITYTYETFVNN